MPPPAALNSISLPPTTVNMELLWTGATTVCVPRVPASPAGVATGGLMGSAARAPSAPAASVLGAPPSTPSARLSSPYASVFRFSSHSLSPTRIYVSS